MESKFPNDADAAVHGPQFENDRPRPTLLLHRGGKQRGTGTCPWSHESAKVHLKRPRQGSWEWAPNVYFKFFFPYKYIVFIHCHHHHYHHHPEMRSLQVKRRKSWRLPRWITGQPASFVNTHKTKLQRNTPEFFDFCIWQDFLCSHFRSETEFLRALKHHHSFSLRPREGRTLS